MQEQPFDRQAVGFGQGRHSFLISSGTVMVEHPHKAKGLRLADLNIAERIDSPPRHFPPIHTGQSIRITLYSEDGKNEVAFQESYYFEFTKKELELPAASLSIQNLKENNGRTGSF
jgi:hypothetical protein